MSRRAFTICVLSYLGFFAGWVALEFLAARGPEDMPLLLAYFGLCAIGPFASLWMLVLSLSARPGRRAYPLLLTPVLLSPLAGIPLVGKSAWWARRGAFEGVARRSEPLIEALEHYREDHGITPEPLEKLVPDYLDAVPTTGLWWSPEYDYWTGRSRRNWRLTIEASRGFLNWDEFAYFSGGAYEQVCGGGVEPIGRWVCYHE